MTAAPVAVVFTTVSEPVFIVPPFWFLIEPSGWSVPGGPTYGSAEAIWSGWVAAKAIPPAAPATGLTAQVSPTAGAGVVETLRVMPAKDGGEPVTGTAWPVAWFTAVQPEPVPV